MAKRKKVLVIDRRKWARGKVGGRLLDWGGKMCCLGFDARACGIPKKVILDMETPGDISSYYSCEDAKTRVTFNDYYVGNSAVVEDAIHFNDNEELTDSQREEYLTPVLKKLGYDEIKFVN